MIGREMYTITLKKLRWWYFSTEQLNICWIAMATEEMSQYRLQNLWQINVSLTLNADKCNGRQMTDVFWHVRRWRWIYAWTPTFWKPLDNQPTALYQINKDHSLYTIHIVKYRAVLIVLTKKHSMNSMKQKARKTWKRNQLRFVVFL